MRKTLLATVASASLLGLAGCGTDSIPTAQVVARTPEGYRVTRTEIPGGGLYVVEGFGRMAAVYAPDHPKQ